MNSLGWYIIPPHCPLTPPTIWMESYASKAFFAWAASSALLSLCSKPSSPHSISPATSSKRCSKTSNWWSCHPNRQMPSKSFNHEAHWYRCQQLIDRQGNCCQCCCLQVPSTNWSSNPTINWSLSAGLQLRLTSVTTSFTSWDTRWKIITINEMLDNNEMVWHDATKRRRDPMWHNSTQQSMRWCGAGQGGPLCHIFDPSIRLKNPTLFFWHVLIFR